MEMVVTIGDILSNLSDLLLRNVAIAPIIAVEYVENITLRPYETPEDAKA